MFPLNQQTISTLPSGSRWTAWLTESIKRRPILDLTRNPHHDAGYAPRFLFFQPVRTGSSGFSICPHRFPHRSAESAAYLDVILSDTVFGEYVARDPSKTAPRPVTLPQALAR